MSISETFVKELLNSIIFSLPEIFKTIKPKIIIKARGIAVITLIYSAIIIKYNAQKAIDLKITADLNTAIIAKEWFIKFKKLIFEGPKYLEPLIDGELIKLISVFAKEPEKLLQVAFSSINFLTVSFARHVQFPNFINFPVNV